MKVLVPVKIIVDYYRLLRFKADGSEIDTYGVKWIINSFDEIAVEEGIRLKEAGKANEVIVASIGLSDVLAQLRHTLAMGADSAILVKCERRASAAITRKL